MREATRLERTRHVVRGERSELRLEDGVVTVTKDATTQTQPTTMTVSVDRVRGTSLERPSRSGRGWLHLAVVDGSPAPPSELAATSDPYTVALTSRQVPAARRLAKMVAEHVQRRGLPHQDEDTTTRPSSGVIVTSAGPATSSAPPQSAAVPPAPPPPPDPATQPGVTGPSGSERLIDQLRELAELHRQGALSDAEFEQAKQRVLQTSPAD